MASQNLGVHISHIFKSRLIVLNLMNKQGYNTADYANFSINEVDTMTQNDQLDMLLETKESTITPNNVKRKIYIKYCLVARPSPKNIREMIDDLFVLSETLKKDDTLFIIIRDEPNETLVNELVHIWESEGIFIVVENIKRLQYNILDHEVVPSHQVMSEIETVDVMKKYNITDRAQFPDISRFDPVARVIGLRPGQVCRIVRPSKTAVEANYYRVCS